MDTKIREYIEELFQDAPRTRKAMELKEEMIVNAEEKYQDLLKEGYRDEDAFSVVIHSIGDVKELFEELDREDGYYWYKEQEFAIQKKKAVLTAISVGLYIFAGVVFFVFALLEDSLGLYLPIDLSLLGLVLAILICIAPTVMLVYASLLMPKHDKKEEQAAEEYREQQRDSNSKKQVRLAISGIIWTMAVVLYFLISFTSGAWHVTWVIYFMAGCLESIVSLLFGLKK